MHPTALPVRIAVNTRLLLRNKLEGIGRFTWEVLRRMVVDHPEHQFYFIFDRPYAEEFVDFSNVTPVVLGPPARHPFLFVWWFELSVASWLNKYQPDVFLSPDGYLSLRANVKQVAVMHDLNFEHFPDDLPFLVRRYYRYFFPKFAQKATRIATVSEFSAGDIASLYGVDRAFIDVVYNGVDEVFTRANDHQIEAFKARFTQGADFFLNVGSIHPRKNTVRMLQAFERFRAMHPERHTLLVLVGDAYWWSAEMKRALAQSPFRSDVVLTGRLPDSDLAIALSAAQALIYVSYFEGFGIPMIEAMRCGTPVVAAQTTALPEVAGEAALYVDPYQVESIAEGLACISSHPQLRESLVEKGKLQAQKYTWRDAAQRLWLTIENTQHAGQIR